MTSLSTQIASSLSSSSSIPQWKYDVFLSFRGEDTRLNFTDHLYDALDRNGIYTFRDEPGLEKGKYIGPGLFEAIEGSRFSIVILSQNYASSKWCLKELVKIFECMEKMTHEVIPIFYGVSPSEVRHQTGNFEQAFAKHEEDFKDDQEMVRGWRAAMTKVGNLKGYHVEDRHETELFKEIIEMISSKLNPTLSCVDNNLVGMHRRLEKLRLNLGLHVVRFVGIWGMGGIGKTTLARVVYEQMSCHFQGSTFLADVGKVSKEGRLVSLQEQLLSQILTGRSFKIWDVEHGINMIRSRLHNRKVLVIIDDVDGINQLQSLAGDHKWFGLGSRIIITTRNEHLLKLAEVDVAYKAEVLHHGEALQLFSSNAFRDDHPPTNYVELSEDVIKYVDCHPLAIKVVGSFLYGGEKVVWENTLEKLEEGSGEDIIDEYETIVQSLQISFDGLKKTHKTIFLDIACFFNGKDKDFVTKILDDNITIIKGLIEKSLIDISHDNKLWVHDLLQEMAKKIVQKDSSEELGKRSRLWDKKDVHSVLTNNLGTEVVEGIIHNFSEQEEVFLSAEAFSNMNKLRVLQISNVKLPHGLDYLSNELRLLEWHRYPLRSLPSSFQPNKIVALNLCYSRIQQLWPGIMPLNKLKFINLSHSEYLTKMPDFTGVPNLETMILEGCTRLSELHSSIGDLKRLILLNLKDCKSLSSLPSSIKWESLEVCILASCSKLKKFPEIIGEMESLKTLDLSETAIEQFPPSIFLLMKNIEELSFRGSKGQPNKSWSPFQLMKRRRLDPMPLRLPSLSVLCCLEYLDLSDCNLWEGTIPDDLCRLPLLEELNLSNNNFVSLPTNINQLSNLAILYLNNCKRLKSLPVLPSKISEIKVSNCTSMEMLSDAPNPYRVGDSFLGFNCFKLVENEGGSNLAFALMKRYLLQVCTNVFSIVVPGSEIPKWFSHQSERASIRIERTALFDMSDDEKIIGFAVCCVFVLHKHPPILDETALISCSLFSPTYRGGGHLDISNEDDKLGRPMSDHLWVEIGGENLDISTEDDKLGRPMSDHLWLVFQRNFSSSLDKNQIKVRFDTMCPGVEVKKFGFRLVYKHEVEEFQSDSSTFEDLNDLHQDLNKSTLDGAKIEKVYDYYDKRWENRRREFIISLTNSGAVWEDL